MTGPALRLLAAGVLALALSSAAGGQAAECRGIWVTPAEVQALPRSGPAWEGLLRWAKRSAAAPRLADQDDVTDVVVLAKALVYARTGEEPYRSQAIEGIMAAIGTEAGGRSLAVARNLSGYVIAADLVDLPPAADQRFRSWLRDIVNEPMLEGRSLRTTNEQRPNNWGLHAGASRLAVALYLGRREDVERIATIFRAWLGDRTAHAGFDFGALDWQADPSRPVGVNPPGAIRDGHPMDGVLPEDQRRCCKEFRWPPPREPYTYEALQGALAQAVMLSRAGYPTVWEWQDRALLRAFTWLHDVADFPAEGDDTWQPHIINYYYGTSFPAPVPSQPGKNVGYSDWTHQSRPATPG